MKSFYIAPLVLLVLLGTAAAQYRDIAWIRGGHIAPVLSHDISPDGRTLVTGSADATIKLWDIETTNLLATLRGHHGVVTSVAFSPDGRSIISGGLDSTIRFWEVESRRQVRLIENGDSVVAVVNAPSIDRLVTRQADGSWRIRDLTGGSVIGEFPSRSGVESRYAWSADGTVIATGGEGDSTIKVWDAKTGAQQTTIMLDSRGISAFAFSPDGNRIASGIWGDTLRVWDAETGSLEQTVGEAIPLNVSGLFYSIGGDSIYLALQGVVEVWDVKGNRKVQEYEFSLLGPTGYWPWSFLNVQELSSHPDGRHLVISGANIHWPSIAIPYINLLDLGNGETVRSYLWHRSAVRAVGFVDTLLHSYDYYFGVVTRLDGTEPVQSGGYGIGEMTNLSSDGRFASSSPGYDDDITFDVVRYDLQEKGRSTIVQQLAAQLRGPLPSWISPGGRYVCYDSNRMVLWDSLDGSNTRRHVFNSGPRSSASGAVAFSPDAKLLAMIQSDHVLLWNISADSTERMIPISSPSTLAFSRKGSYLAAGGADGTITIWEVASGTIVRTLSEHRGGIRGLVFCKDDRFLVSAGADSTVRTWIVETGVNDYTYDEYPSVQLSVAVTSDGQHIASGTEDGSFIMWQARGAIASAEAVPMPSFSQSTLHCYPLPASTTVTIECDLVRPGRVEIQVMDQLGREVAIVADGEYEAGVHRFRWDAGALPAGIYHCRLRTASEVITGQIVLVR